MINNNTFNTKKSGHRKWCFFLSKKIKAILHPQLVQLFDFQICCAGNSINFSASPDLFCFALKSGRSPDLFLIKEKTFRVVARYIGLKCKKTALRVDLCMQLDIKNHLIYVLMDFFYRFISKFL